MKEDEKNVEKVEEEMSVLRKNLKSLAMEKKDGAGVTKRTSKQHAKKTLKVKIKFPVQNPNCPFLFSNSVKCCTFMYIFKNTFMY